MGSGTPKKLSGLTPPPSKLNFPGNLHFWSAVGAKITCLDWPQDYFRQFPAYMNLVALYLVRFGCASDTDSNRAMPTARETSKTQTLRNTGPCLSPFLLVGIQQFRRVRSIGSLPPENLGKSRGPPQNPAEPRRTLGETPAEPSERPPQSPLRGKFSRRASRRVVPLGW